MKRLFHSLSRTNDGAFVIDDCRRIIFWNQAAEKIMGYTAEEVSGLHCYEILGGRDEQGHTLCRLFCRMAIQVRKGAILPNQNVQVHTRTGERRWLNVTTFTYSVSDKTMTEAIVHIFRDITEQKNYQRFVESVLSATERLHGTRIAQVVPVTATDSQLDRLTKRERQVLDLLAQGLSTDEIAGTLTISMSTTRNHVQNILGKLGAHSRPEAIAYAYQNGLRQR